MGHPVCLGHTPRASHCWSPASWPCKDPGLVGAAKTLHGPDRPWSEGGKLPGAELTGPPKCRRLQRGGEKRGPGPALPHRASGVQQSPCQAWTPPSHPLPTRAVSLKCKPVQASLPHLWPSGWNQEKRASPTITVNDSSKHTWLSPTL